PTTQACDTPHALLREPPATDGVVSLPSHPGDGIFGDTGLPPMGSVRMLRCLLCSAELPDGGLHCPACGAPVTQEPTRLYDPAAPDHGTLIKGRSAPLSGGTASPRFGAGRILAGRYRIVALLGQGGMGEVYRAEDLKLGQPVALKFLPRELASDPVRRARFFAEVRITRQLSHPNIC